MQCGFTPQYTELEEIYKKYSKDVSVNKCGRGVDECEWVQTGVNNLRTSVNGCGVPGWCGTR